MIPPRLSPPIPRRSRWQEWRAAAKRIGFRPMPWQAHVSRVTMAEWRGRWRYPESAIVVARQNGKSSFLVPRIVAGLLGGERIMHTAQNRELPREIFGLVADAMIRAYPDALASTPRTANGQETILSRAGGRYRIVAPSSRGARGPTNDLVIVDEVRELDTWEFVNAARPTMTASRNPQMLFLSNAGDETSVVLNALRRRAEVDDSLAYIEWSADPALAVDDRDGWRQANPAWGYLPVEANLEAAFSRLALENNLAAFETEHLCRWVDSMRPRLVADIAWQRGQGAFEPPAVRPALGIAVDALGRRASAVLAWPAGGRVFVRLAADVFGDPGVDLDTFGRELRELARRVGAHQVAFDPATDRDLARWFGENAKPIAGDSAAAAAGRFVGAVEGGRLTWGDDSAAIGADLAFVSRTNTRAGAYIATPARDDRPVTAALAAVRAVWLATAPRPPAPSIH